MGHKYCGGKNTKGKYIFRQHSQKNFFYSQKNCDDLFFLFLVIVNFFKNLQPSFKFYSLFFVFFSLCLFFCVLSCFFRKNKKNKKVSSDYLGGGKNRVLTPTLIIGGRVPGLPPRVYAYAFVHY